MKRMWNKKVHKMNTDINMKDLIKHDDSIEAARSADFSNEKSGLNKLCVFVAICFCACLFSCGKPVKEDEVVDLKGIKIFKKEKKIEVEGSVCINYGILEYFIVAKDGRTYESVFVIDCLPSYLNTALLLIGAKQGVFPDEFKGDKKGELKKKNNKNKKDIGSKFEIFVEWKKLWRRNCLRAENFLWDRNKKTFLNMSFYQQ